MTTTSQLQQGGTHDNNIALQKEKPLKMVKGIDRNM
jgi:hypothetical protein